MRIAVTYENGQIFQHFGHTEQFKVYTIEDGKIVASEVIDTNSCRCFKRPQCRCTDLRRYRRRCSHGS